MYLINTYFKKTKLGGLYYCSIYEVFNNYRHEQQCRDVTESMSNRLGIIMEKGYIVIEFGYGTGFSILREGIEKATGSQDIYDISISL